MSGLMPDDDISDTQADSSSFVPNLTPMQNTPFNNAQSKLPNQFPYNNGPSLNQSSLGSNNPSINNQLQQKMMQKFPNQPPPPTPQSLNSMQLSQGGQGPGPSNPTMQQQMAQQQILQQLRMAVQAGLISPQLLNRQLPTPVLVMLQQLLQQQQNLQQLITTQHMLQQNKLKMNPILNRQQSDEVANKVQIIKQQILLLQKNITAAQKIYMDKNDTQQPQQQPPQQPPPQQQPQMPVQQMQQQPQASPDSNENALQNELQNLSIASSQPQSRLNQWRKSTPDKESQDEAGTPTPTSEQPSTPTSMAPTSSSSDLAGSDKELNKTVGSKPIQQSSSRSNLQRFDDLGISNLGGDSTWSNSASTGSQNWPNPSSESGDKSDSESLSSTAPSTTASNTVLDTIPAIPEFVPGKPWQGISAKNVEDDPHITPGSFARSLSVNTIKDDYLISLTKSSPNNDTNSSWPPRSDADNSKPWSSGENNSLTPNSFSSEVWGVQMNKGAMSRPPPGLPPGQQKWTGMNRQHSWAGSATRLDGMSAIMAFMAFHIQSPSHLVACEAVFSSP